MFKSHFDRRIELKSETIFNMKVNRAVNHPITPYIIRICNNQQDIE